MLVLTDSVVPIIYLYTAQIVYTEGPRRIVVQYTREKTAASAPAQ